MPITFDPKPGKGVTTVIAQLGDIWADYIEAESPEGAMIKVMAANEECLLGDIIAVIEGKHTVQPKKS